MVNDNNERIAYLDIAKGIGIILVIMGHTGFLGKGAQSFITSFHMPLFFIISGILFSYKVLNDINIKEFTCKRAKRILIPYVIFSFIYVIINLIELKFGVTSQKEIGQKIIYSLILYSDSTLWFLPALFLSEVLFVVMKQKVHVHKLFDAYILPVCTLIISTVISREILIRNPQSLVDGELSYVLAFFKMVLRVLISYFFIEAGYWFGTHVINNEKMRLSTKNTKSRFNYIQILLGVLLLVLTCLVSNLNLGIDYRRLVFHNVFLFTITSLLGTTGVILISVGIDRSRLLEFYGKNSLIIMCTHINFYVLYISIQWAWFINNYITRAKSYIFMFNIVLAALVIETLIIFIIKGIKCLKKIG